MKHSVASSIRVETILPKIAMPLGFAHSLEAPEAFIVTARSSRVRIRAFFQHKSLHPSSGFHKVPMDAVHGLVECNRRWMDGKPAARAQCFWVIKCVDPGYPRQPARPGESFVDILVVQIVDAFAAHVSVHAVVPRRIPWAGTDATDQFLYFLLEALHFFFTFGFCLFPGFATSIGTFVSLGTCGCGSHYSGRRVDRRRGLH